MSFKVTILGSGSSLASRGRHHSGQVLNIHEQLYLIDCGEGSQSRMREFGVSMLKINTIFITHLHGDHIYGLFPLISTMGLMGRTRSLKIFAPHPFMDILAHMEIVDRRRSFEIEYHPVDTTAHALIYENSSINVWSIPLRHRIPTAGYLFREREPKRNIRKEMIERYNLDLTQIVAAKRGEDIVLGGGELIKNSDLTYIPHLARSFAHCSDTLYSNRVLEIVRGVDLLYHEATFSDDDKALAKQTGHTTAKQAGELAKKAGVGRLMIGHFSGRYKSIEPLVEESRLAFPQTIEATEGDTVEVTRREWREGVDSEPTEALDSEPSGAVERITTEQFKQMLTERIEPNFGRYFGDIVVANQLWEEALGLGFHSDERVAFRASYALERAYFRDKGGFMPHISRFLKNYSAVTNRGAHRHYSKILCDIISSRSCDITPERFEQLAERAFDLLIDPKSKVAVKVWSMDLLFLMSTQLGWIDEHLSEVVERQMELTPTPAMINHGKKLLKRINVAKIKR